MPHIDLKNDLPGMRSVLAYSPETAAPIGVLAKILLRSEEGLQPGRKRINGYVCFLFE